MEFYSGQPENPAASVRDYCTGVLTIAVGEVLEVPETFLEGRISKKPKAYFEEQIAKLYIGQ